MIIGRPIVHISYRTSPSLKVGLNPVKSLVTIAPPELPTPTPCCATLHESGTFPRYWPGRVNREKKRRILASNCGLPSSCRFGLVPARLKDCGPRLSASPIIFEAPIIRWKWPPRACLIWACFGTGFSAKGLPALTRFGAAVGAQRTVVDLPEGFPANPSDPGSVWLCRVSL